MVIAQNENYGYLEKWYLDLKPSTVTFHNTKTGERVVEPSYVAMEIKEAPAPVDSETGRSASARTILLGQPLAIGKAALAYQNTPGVAVFSPFREGQIANWGLSAYFIQTLLLQVRPRSLFKPVLCIHTQEQTTPVEERAFVDAGLQAGARRVYLYKESLPVMLDHVAENRMKEIKDSVLIHIEPQD